MLFLISLLLEGCKDSPKATENAKNIKRIELGMSLDSVELIMGEPEVILIYPYNKEEYKYRYISPSGYSGEFYIFISRRDSVVLRLGDGR